MARMPVSRGRKPKKGRKSQLPEHSVHDDLIRMFGTLVKAEETLDVEIFTSDVLGMWWQEFPSDLDPERSMGIEVVTHALRRGTPSAMAMLCALAATATAEELREAAQECRAELAAQGVAEPPWGSAIGRVEVGDCWQLSDVYGDQSTLCCEFGYGTERHTLVALLDHGDMYDWAKDLWISAEPDAVLAELRETATKDPLMVLERIEPATARRLLESAIEGSDDPLSELDLAKEFADHRAIALARCRAMPGPDEPPVPAEVSVAERAAIVEEFLASPEGGGLPPEAEHLAQIVVDFGADEDLGRPLRVSPGKTSALFAMWLSTDPTLDERHRAAVGSVYTAWNRWAAARMGLPEAAYEELDSAVAHCAGVFEEDYQQNARRAQELASRYLADLSDLEPDELDAAMIRRMFAVPPLSKPGEEMPDPSDSGERRAIIALEHEDVLFGSEEPDVHIAIHEALADQLWGNEPPEVWAAAQRLTASGQSRHDVLHQLCEVLVAHLGGLVGRDGEAKDDTAYRTALNALVPAAASG
jgi:hypothetical protein